MTFFIQHGYGKSNKIQTVAAGGNLAGTILSAGDEDASALAMTARECADAGMRVLVDPQTYVYSTQPPGRGRNHGAHGIELDQLTWALDAHLVAEHVEAVGRLNQAVNPEGTWVAPSPVQESFSDLWTPLSVQFARTAGQEWGAERTIATVAVEEVGLSEWSSIERWLDVATTLPVAGFYLLISRQSTSYPGIPWSSTRLSNLLRLIHVLSDLNEFEVIWGYSDFEGLLGLGVGADAMASGWSYTLRQFSTSKWMSPPRSGGRPPTVRIPISRLWSLLRAEAEAGGLFESDLRETVFSAAEIARYESRPFEAIGIVDAQLEYLNAMASGARALTNIGDLSSRLSFLERGLGEAIALWKSISGAGILAEPSYASRVKSLHDALRLFRDQVAL